MISKDPTIRSDALSVDPRQVREANEWAKKMGCGEPFRPDGQFEAGRSLVKKYVTELNKRAVDRGEDRIVNFDGGYGDPT